MKGRRSLYPIGRLTQIASGGTNYLTVNSADYNAASEPSKVTYGNTVQGNFGYNARLQLQSLSYTQGFVPGKPSILSQAAPRVRLGGRRAGSILKLPASELTI
jgi:hypothetical protein